MFSNEFSKNCQDFRINPAEARIVVQGLAPGSTDLWLVDFRSGALKLPLNRGVCWMMHVYREYESFL